MSVTDTTAAQLAWATVHALERGATWGPTCECVDPLVAEDELDEDMPARCVRCGRRETARVPEAA